MNDNEPVAWAAINDNGDIAWIGYTQEAAADGASGRPVVPLYRQPQPTLTDAEREAIGIVAEWASDHLGEDDPGVTALVAFLERTK